METSTAEPECKILINREEEQEHEQEQEVKISGDDDCDGEERIEGLDIIESLCMRCGGTGQTRLKIHKIPYFRELIIASFVCEECGERNNEVTFGGEIQLQGCKITLNVITPDDLNRQIVKSDSATLKLVEIDLEIPSVTQKGEINTIEGILKSIENNLSLDQEFRMRETPEIGLQISAILGKLSAMSQGKLLPFTIVIDDPTGNSFIQNPVAPEVDKFVKTIHYYRTPQQDMSLGLDPSKGLYKPDETDAMRSVAEGSYLFGGLKSSEETPDEVSQTNEEIQLGRSEAVSIPSQCPNCGSIGESLTALTDIPHFKEVIIMAFGCKICGFRTNEVKGGGAVPTYGTEVRLHVRGEDDLKRDVLKSDSAMITIPELELELGHGTLGGMFTTVEGLLHKIYTSLKDQNSMVYGDSATKHHSQSDVGNETRKKFDEFLGRLFEYFSGKVFPFQLIIRDPLGNSFISAPLGTFLPPEADSNLNLEDFERSFEENEEFGLNELNTKDYETGYEESGSAQGPVLPDRLTQHYKKEVDHPTPFAKGTNVDDSTVGGFYNSGNITEDMEQMDNEGSREYCAPPTGWTFEKKRDESSNETEVPNDIIDNENVILKRQFSDDNDLDFIPREEFGGMKTGYVFRLGSKGLGYYSDIKFSDLKIESFPEN